MWEDPANKDGGRCTLRVTKGFADLLWENLLMAVIGEQFQDANEINGVVVSIKPHGDQIQIWIRNGRDEAKIERIKQDLINLLQLPKEVRVDYDKFFKDEEVSRPAKSGFGGGGGYMGKKKPQGGLGPRY